MGLGAQDHLPGARLGAWEQDHALLEVDGLAPEEPDLREAHEGKHHLFHHLTEGRPHRVEDEEFLLWP